MAPEGRKDGDGVPRHGSPRKPQNGQQGRGGAIAKARHGRRAEAPDARQDAGRPGAPMRKGGTNGGNPGTERGRAPLILRGPQSGFDLAAHGGVLRHPPMGDV